jgi:hypothetical protein
MKNVCLLVLFTLVAAVSFAQDEELEEKRGFDKSRLFLGGNFGASFGDYTLINVSPQLGYRFSDFFAAGAGVNFIYSSLKYRDLNDNPVYKDASAVTGLNLFGRVYPLRQVMLQVQPEMNYISGKRKFYDGSSDIKLEKEFVPSLLLGAGAAIPAGRGAFMAMLQYDVLQRPRSPYGERPFLSFGYTMGF